MVTLLVLLFARDVTRSAHGSTATRRSENLSFAQMANILLDQENQVDAHLSDLLAHGQALSRAVFASQLSQIAQVLPLWATESRLLERPVLAHHVNRVISQLTTQRIEDYGSVLNAVATSLALPWHPITTTISDPAVAQAALLTTASQWNAARWSLAREPGRAVLNATTSLSARLNLSSDVTILASSPKLVLTRGFVITAVLAIPSPLPGPRGELLLPPVGSVQIGVTISNEAYVTQPVRLSVTLAPAGGSGTAQRQVLTASLGPLQSYAFALKPLVTSAGERATLTISVTGASNGSLLEHSRTYRVVFAPSGNG